MIKKMDENEFEQKLDYYRQNYFLDPNGSNIDLFLKNSQNMLTKLLEIYTGKEIEVEFEEPNIENGCVNVKINDKKKTKDAINFLSSLGTEAPQKGNSIEDLVNALSTIAEGEVMFNHKFMGQMHPHDNMPSFISGLAGKFLNGNTIAEEVSPVTTYAEMQAVSWIAKEMGYNPDNSWMTVINIGDKEQRKVIEEIIKGSSSTSSGNITAGGTSANLSALIVAKNKAFPGAAEEGMQEKTGLVFGSEYSHYSHEKLCGYIGIGSKNFVKVKTKQHKIDNVELKKEMRKAGKNNTRIISVVAAAGTTETGNIDDLKGIADIIDEFEKDFGYRPHFHVDAAHGGGFIFHNEFSYKGGKLAGIERADSITIDPHKMLYTNYSAGMILFKDKKDHGLLKQSAGYLFKEDGNHNLGQYRTEGSMGLEGTLQAWGSLYALGREGYEVIQENALRLTGHLKAKLEKEMYFEIINEPETNILCFRYYNKDLTDELNDKINKKAQEKMHSNGNLFFSNDKLLYRKTDDDNWQNIEVFRAVLIHPYTTKKDVEDGITEVKTCLTKTLTEYRKRIDESVKLINEATFFQEAS